MEQPAPPVGMGGPIAFRQGEHNVGLPLYKSDRRNRKTPCRSSDVAGCDQTAESHGERQIASAPSRMAELGQLLP